MEIFFFLLLFSLFFSVNFVSPVCANHATIMATEHAYTNTHAYIITHTLMWKMNEKKMNKIRNYVCATCDTIIIHRLHHSAGRWSLRTFAWTVYGIDEAQHQRLWNTINKDIRQQKQYHRCAIRRTANDLLIHIYIHISNI